MAGNIWEWCADSYAADYYATGISADPQGPARLKVLRGGSWVNPNPVVRTTSRFELLPTDRGPVGFLCAR